MRQFLVGKDRTDLYVRALKTLRELLETQGEGAVGCVYAEAVAEAHEETFARSRGLKRSDGHACIERLLGHRCHGIHSGPPAGDHDTLWLKGGKPVLYLAQPYGLGWDKMRELIAFCLRHGLRADVDVWPSFHFPAHVISVYITREKGIV